MIKVSGLNKYYNKGKSNELHVINDTTIELPDDGLICILGESGSGKTTLMNTISGLDNFAGGTIEVDGVEIKKFGDSNQERVRNEKFGYIFQSYYLLQDRTVEYNLMISLGLYNISDEEKEERIDYVLKAVDMWRYKKRLVSQLSGGQQQRIAIARALAKSPRVIFADEPTGNLDEANTMRIMGILKKISKTCLVVVVTHEKSIADFFADRILWISDGKIEDDKEKTSQTSYKFVEDTNLYLGEYEKIHVGNDKINVESYTNVEMPNVEIKLVYENGKIYVSLGNAKNVEFLTSDSEKKIIEGKKPVIQLTDVDDLEYSLEELEYAKKPKLGLKEVKNIALDNIKAMGKRQIFLVASLLAMSIMMVLAVQDILTIIAINEEEVVSTDSHYLEVILEKDGLIQSKAFLNAKKEIFKEIKNNEKLYNEIVLNPKTSLSYTYTGFVQLENIKTNMQKFTFVPIDKLSEEKLIYGRMPENDYEIVVDRWALEQYINEANEISNVINDIKHFLDKKVTTSNRVEFTIVGISESEEMNVYVKKDVIIQISKYTENYKTYSEYIANLDKEYSGKALGLNENGNYEILVSESVFLGSHNIYATSAHPKIREYENVRDDYENFLHYYNNVMEYYDLEAEGNKEYLEEVEMEHQEKKDRMDKYYKKMLEHYGVDTYEQCCEIRSDSTGYTFEKNTKTGSVYTVVGYFSDELKEEIGVEMIIADEAEDMILADLLAHVGEFYVYAENENDVKDFFSTLPEELFESISYSITNPYDEALDQYKEEKAEQFNGRIIVTITIFVVSMIILYFMMKANAVQRMQDLGVYRLIGISKSSIVGIFAFENAVITTYTSLVGAVLATFATYLVSSIPSLGVNINYPWYAFLLTVFFLYVTNILVGILPIRKILKLPPAQLATKYDI